MSERGFECPFRTLEGSPACGNCLVPRHINRKLFPPKFSPRTLFSRPKLKVYQIRPDPFGVSESFLDCSTYHAFYQHQQNFTPKRFSVGIIIVFVQHVFSFQFTRNWTFGFELKKSTALLEFYPTKVLPRCTTSGSHCKELVKWVVRMYWDHLLPFLRSNIWTIIRTKNMKWESFIYKYSFLLKSLNLPLKNNENMIF